MSYIFVSFIEALFIDHFLYFPQIILHPTGKTWKDRHVETVVSLQLISKKAELKVTPTWIALSSKALTLLRSSSQLLTMDIQVLYCDCVRGEIKSKELFILLKTFIFVCSYM